MQGTGHGGEKEEAIGIFYESPRFLGRFTGRDCCSGKAAAYEAVYVIPRMGCNDADAERSVRLKGKEYQHINWKIHKRTD